MEIAASTKKQSNKNEHDGNMAVCSQRIIATFVISLYTNREMQAVDACKRILV